MDTLPRYINVTRVITFDVQNMQDLIHQLHKEEDEEVTLDEVIERIESELFLYFPGNQKDLIWTDENGDELE